MYSKFCSIRIAAQKQGVEHLLALGHQQIALLTGPLESVSARLRYEGWLETLQQQIAPCAIQHGDWSAASGYQLALLLLTACAPDGDAGGQ